MQTPPPMLWRCRERTLEIGSRTLVMGILNVTPDSFSDGGAFLDPARAIDHAIAMEADGADILDLGAESTRPNSDSVTPAEQIARLEGIMKRLRPQTQALISIDTASAEVARHMLGLGADIINDVTALRGDAQMAEVLAKSRAGCVLMHMLGTPRTMQQNPQYSDVVGEVKTFLRERIHAAREAGIRPEQIAIDPGIGFGKTVEHNLALIRDCRQFLDLDRPLLIGASRKSFIGSVLDVEIGERLEGSLAAAAVSVMNGASIVRVHDVKPTRRVVDMVHTILKR